MGHHPTAVSEAVSPANGAPGVASDGRPAVAPSVPPAAKTSLQIHRATGTVKSVDAATKLINIAHDDIPGYMSAMVMPFEAASPEQLGTVRKGDKVGFSFTDDGNGRRVLQRLTTVP